MGRPKARVLPDPVWPRPRTSRPARASGMVASWIDGAGGGGEAVVLGHRHRAGRDRGAGRRGPRVRGQALALRVDERLPVCRALTFALEAAGPLVPVEATGPLVLVEPRRPGRTLIALEAAGPLVPVEPRRPGRTLITVETSRTLIPIETSRTRRPVIPLETGGASRSVITAETGWPGWAIVPVEPRRPGRTLISHPLIPLEPGRTFATRIARGTLVTGAGGIPRSPGVAGTGPRLVARGALRAWRLASGCRGLPAVRLLGSGLGGGLLGSGPAGLLGRAGTFGGGHEVDQLLPVTRVDASRAAVRATG